MLCKDSIPDNQFCYLQKGPAFSPRRSPRGPLNSLFEDLNISITQKPKCEKGFGFTVRGGDDGRPVVVNTVSPGKLIFCITFYRRHLK